MKHWRKRLARLLESSSIAANLKLLGVAGLVLFITLVASMFYVQQGLIDSQQRLIETTLPIRRALGRLDAALGSAFRREAQLSSTQNLKQLAPLRERRAIERELRDAHAQLTQLWPRETPDDEISEMREHMEAFLVTDAELAAAIEHRHELQSRFDAQMAAVNQDLREVIEQAQSITGVLRLQFIVTLREIDKQLKRTGAAPPELVRAITVGSTRGALDNMAELVDAILALGVVVGKTGVAPDHDVLRAIAANELAQQRTHVGRVFEALQPQLQDESLLERLNELKRRLDNLDARVTDEDRPASLVGLRASILDESARAKDSHELGIKRARALSQVVEKLRSKATNMATRAVRAASAATTRGRWFSGWVSALGVLVCVFAALRIRQSVAALQAHTRELESLKENLEHVNRNLEGIVEQRTAALAQREHALQLVLDSMSDGLISVAPDGTLRPERSKSVVEWFGEPAPDATVWSYLFPDDSSRAEAFKLHFEQLVSQELPFELCLEQMPRWIERDGRSFELDFQPVHEGEGEAQRLSGVVAAIRDVTQLLEAERAERLAREEQRTIAHLLRDKRGFGRMMRECESLVGQVLFGDDLVLRRRALHTLKGNCAIFGLTSVAELAHTLETSLDEDGALSDEHCELLRTTWHDAMVRLDEFVVCAQDSYEVLETDLAVVLSALQQRADYQEILDMVEAFRLEPTAASLKRLGAQARRLAQELGKELRVQVVDNGVRIAPESFQSLFSAFVHAIRNAVDHGIEPQAERVAAGKPQPATLSLRSGKTPDGQLVFELADDGRGVDWEQVRAKARQRGLPAGTPDELQAALFSDGFSTRDVATKLSGRGVGMSALRAACEELSGTVELLSTLGHGTTLRCIIPIPERLPTPASRRSRTPSNRASRSLRASRRA